MAVLRVLGFDPSMNNWGIAAGLYDTDTDKLTITTLSVTCPKSPKGKQVRKNCKDLEVAEQLAIAAFAATLEAQAIFVEVPVGSQSARAMASYGICVGILAAMRARGVAFFEVTPTEVKLAALNNSTASKSDMINWGVSNYPDANWPYYPKNGQMHLSKKQAEHMADAIAAIHAGVKLPEFQRLRQMAAA